MPSRKQQSGWLFGTRLRAAWNAVAIVILFVLTVVTPPGIQAQTYRLIHSFTGGLDGGGPAGVTIDRIGNPFCATEALGSYLNGAVFELSYRTSAGVLDPLYEFAGGTDGATPNTVVLGPNGSLYGTTNYGGRTATARFFDYAPPATACTAAICFWDETVLYRFMGGSDGAVPQNGTLVFDQSGSLYGTAAFGGEGCSAYGGCGTVFELTPRSGGWVEHVLYRFTGGSDGAQPIAGVTFDKTGSLYGTTGFAGNLDCPGMGAARFSN